MLNVEVPGSNACWFKAMMSSFPCRYDNILVEKSFITLSGGSRGVSGVSTEPLRAWWDQVSSLGPSFGYFPNASKTWLVTKQQFNSI